MFLNKCKYKLKIGTIYNIYYFFITRLWNTFYLEKKNSFMKHIYRNHNHRLTYSIYILSFNKLQKYWHSVCNFRFFFSTVLNIKVVQMLELTPELSLPFQTLHSEHQNVQHLEKRNMSFPILIDCFTIW